MSERKRPKPADYFADWKQREALAEAMIPVVGRLYRERNLKVYVYGRSLVAQSVLDIMKTHRFVRQVEKNELSEFDTWPLVEALGAMDLGTGHVDIGRLTVAYHAGPQAAGLSPAQYLATQLAGLVGSKAKPVTQPRDVVLYGFGRIGRLMARLLIEKAGGGDVLRLRAVVVRRSSSDDLAKRAALLRRDSIHGSFKGTIRVDDERNSFIANGNEVKLIHADAPENIDYTAHGINDAIVIDNTGKWRDEQGLSRHLQSKGVAKVILTAPGKGALKNIVYGVNHDTITESDRIITAASCTTNAIVPALKAIDEQFGIVSGHVETVHAYTNDQNLIDNFHPKNRRGRSAALNMVLTETGAASAIAKVLPSMAGKLTGNAIRVPVPDVSMAILHLTLSRETSVVEVNEFMRWASLHSPLNRQIDYTASPEVVSSDFVGSRSACIHDAQATIVSGNHAILYLWYDNEFGYACQVQRVLEHVAGVHYAVYPAPEAVNWNWPQPS
ncbi:MAG: glyceraldehyde-3-phosphate dehydrogenase [Pseudomonadales bacterium]|jgi:glyceraldehyde 3-phosphate dehydrogenase|nr:glyceraldehyde-3-phosphate dehydrogenase [Gammaproteobacteria bacterium]MBP6051237.1 glyceraldehyde-3-phosphate dehydrogenase [Pseudomonadales bacterium]MBK6581583.1 glyceraldehyde-3-phosphate dehydrogenase [Gammaproteobacteria bacterium]MBK7522344.1 glyceraldehyde-3-phosphate dehydrogenase [Gammaproteobacteria bacterium]MBK9664276.1 glyceraldehyde-3-phosphate dehydrogenase [Gammaproteobacteria bacterium]